MGEPENSRRIEAIAALLADAAPLLKARIRGRRGARMANLGTSDVYASVVRRAIAIERSEGLDAFRRSEDPAANERSEGSDANERSAGLAEDGRGMAESDAPQEPTRTDLRGLRRLLHMLVDRVLVDAKRREGAERRALRAHAAAGDGSAAANPAQAALGAEDRARLVELVRSLGDTDRELLHLKLSGHPWDEVGARLGLTPAACRQRWHRLAGSIAQMLDPETRS
ncbi:MAG: hypothetical protein ACOYMM_04715 [Phycisphaerales bacterium]